MTFITSTPRVLATITGTIPRRSDEPNALTILKEETARRYVSEVSEAVDSVMETRLEGRIETDEIERLSKEVVYSVLSVARGDRHHRGYHIIPDSDAPEQFAPYSVSEHLMTAFNAFSR